MELTQELIRETIRRLRDDIKIAEGQADVARTQIVTFQRRCLHPSAFKTSHMGESCRDCPDCGACGV